MYTFSYNACKPFSQALYFRKICDNAYFVKIKWKKKSYTYSCMTSRIGIGFLFRQNATNIDIVHGNCEIKTTQIESDFCRCSDNTFHEADRARVWPDQW